MTGLNITRSCAFALCGKEFETQDPHAHYCSKQCQERAEDSALYRTKPKKEELQLEIRTSLPDSTTILLELTGEVNIWTAPHLKEEALDHYSDETMTFILDLTDMIFIDSTGLGVFVSLAKRVRPKKGHIKIVCVDEKIIQIFKITGLDRIFDIFPTQAEALKE